MAVAFVFAGGGGLAAAQVGMLRALRQADIVPDLLVGSSAGAINAFCFARHPTEDGLDSLQELWCGLRRRDVFPLNPWHVLAGLFGRRDGLLSPAGLRDFLRRHIGSADLSDTVLPVHAVATDLADGQPFVLSGGDAVDALLASSALPGVFPPVAIGGRRFVDGGVTADTPVRQAEELGATTIYVLPAVGPSPMRAGGPAGAVPVLLHAVGHLFGRAVATELDAVRATVHVLPAPRHQNANPFDFGSIRRLIDLGYQNAGDALGLPSPGRRCQPPPRPTAVLSLRSA